MTKKFTVTFTSDAQTHWIQDDDFINHQLRFIADSLAASATNGIRPDVTVTEQEPDFFRQLENKDDDK